MIITRLIPLELSKKSVLSVLTVVKFFKIQILYPARKGVVILLLLSVCQK